MKPGQSFLLVRVLFTFFLQQQDQVGTDLQKHGAVRLSENVTYPQIPLYHGYFIGTHMINQGIAGYADFKQTHISTKTRSRPIHHMVQHGSK